MAMKHSTGQDRPDRKTKRNLIMFPLGTVGRDMMYSLVTSYLLTFVLYAHTLTSAQLTAIIIIMIAARVFDALNDPLMGCVIERTRSRFGKFKPWLCIGILSTSLVIYLIFNVKLQGWAFVIFFGIMYFLYSITYTMHDIAYWSMIPALSSEADLRNQYTSRAALFAGIGAVLASSLIPVLTAGNMALGGNTLTAYGRVALIIAVLGPLFIAFTVFGVQEGPKAQHEPAAAFSVRDIFSTIIRNRQLLWIALVFLLQQISNGLVSSGFGQTYIYLRYGYDGMYYSVCQTLGVSVTAFLMLFYPALSRRMTRKTMMRLLMVLTGSGYGIMLVSGFLPPFASFMTLTAGYMLVNFGQYGFYLIMMISIMNTIEYNEYQFGERDESIIASLRPFLTKLSSAINIGIVNITYIAAGIIRYTNGIADLEQASSINSLSPTEKAEQITALLSHVQHTQTIGLLAAMTALPCLLIFVAYRLYQKNFKLDEREYERICHEIALRRQAEET